MARTMHIDPTLEPRLTEAARVSGLSIEHIVVAGIERECATILASRLSIRLAGLVGTVRSRGGRARRTGDAFRSLLRRRR